MFNIHGIGAVKKPSAKSKPMMETVSRTLAAMLGETRAQTADPAARVAQSVSSCVTILANEPSVGLAHVQESLVEHVTPLVASDKEELLELLGATREINDDTKVCLGKLRRMNEEDAPRISACLGEAAAARASVLRLIAGRTEQQTSIGGLHGGIR